MIKISAIISEYNPFHNGHEYSLQQAKLAGDYLAVIQSGNFTQRGEVAITDKYTRAIHAIKAGADIVLELPTVYATANAEIFALGGIKIFNLINATTLCFGAEKNDANSFLSTAKASLSESKAFKKSLNKYLKLGYKFAKAKSLALGEQEGVDKDLLCYPNNILALEYTKALLKSKKPFTIYPIKRIGADFLETDFSGKYSSASAIRNSLNLGEKLKEAMPLYSYLDLPKTPPCLDKEIIYSISTKTLKELKNIPDVSEGLENRILSCAQKSFTLEELLKNLATKRYTNTRLQRILINSLLNIDKKLLEIAKKTTPYVKVLAIKKDKLDLLGTISQTCQIITRKSDYDKLNKNQKLIFEKDILSCEIYSLATNKQLNPFEMKIVE